MAAPESFAYQGQIIKPDGHALEASSVDFIIEIVSPGAEECILFEESHTINMTNSNGLFSLEIGSGARTGTDYEDVTSLNDALSKCHRNSITNKLCHWFNLYASDIGWSKIESDV